MDFTDIILNLEESNDQDIYLMKIGEVPVILTAVHTMEQVKDNGEIKYAEPFTKAIARYVSDKVGTFYYIKTIDTGIDSNKITPDEFKDNLIKMIKEYNIKLLIDLHGAKSEREFDVEFGTLNNLSIDATTVKSLESSFIDNGVTKISYNNPFKGGGITQTVFDQTNIDIVQIEINKRFRSITNVKNIEKICNSLIDFVKKYSNFQ